ncbi:MAG: hypothetical protein V4689_10480 [Verrucomicrobiota bacterium]
MPRNVEEPPPSRPAYFWWLLANILALCFAVVSWFVCLSIFGNPELPRNYQILKKLGRTPVLKKYSLNEIPNGNSRAPKELYSHYFKFTDKDLADLNSILLRNYLTNFDQPLFLNYIEGEYEVLKVRKLGPADFFNPGIVVRAQALVKPDDFTKAMPYPVFIEYVFPTLRDEAADAFKTGDILVVKKSPNCAAVVHVSRITHEGDPGLLLTVIPIAYEKYQLGAMGSFEIEPPLTLRPESGFPVFKD